MSDAGAPRNADGSHATGDRERMYFAPVTREDAA